MNGRFGDLLSRPFTPMTDTSFGQIARKLSGMATCNHLIQIKPVHPNTKGCEECLKIGQSWVHLRMCMECGHVGCCDSSIGKHATKHFHATKHPIMRSIEPGESWYWCYVDELTFELD